MIFDKLNEPGVLKILIPLSAVAVISRTFPLFSFFYYLLPLLFLLILFAGYKFVLKDNALRILLILLLLFGLWCAVTSLWSDYPLVTLSRSGYFIFVSFGAVIGGYLWQRVNTGAFTFILPANIIVIGVSVFSLLANIPSESWTGGNGKGFMGFAGHQNTLASVILFTLPAILNKIPSLKGNKRGGFFLLLFLNLLILLLTFSRASILSLLCGVIVFLILNKKWNTLAYSSAVILLIFSLVWFSPSLKMEAQKFASKDFPAFYSTREWMWVPSYKAALNGGLFGIGYGISDPDIIVPGTGSHYDNGRYIREKGNSFLALIEETGAVGLVLFILPLIYLFYTRDSRYQMPDTRYRIPDKNPDSNILQRESVIRNRESEIQHPASSISYPATGIRNPSSIFHQPSSIIIPVLAAFIIHSQFEAWMVGVGSIQLPLFFFYLGSFINLSLKDSSN